MATEKWLIDANAFLSSMIKRFKCVPLIGRNDYDCESLKQMLIEAPTVDAVPVVRCKGCRYYEPPEDGDSLGVCKNGRLCVSNMGEVYPVENYYCPYGERKADGAV